ncbi:hypothetical protein [Paenibacillus ottowii]|uniref:Uncharacterized protein n=1 Tax=Paenibacillus ottowii TaxID=2315729 RepID=A0ABY3B0Z0_9BACL|nr:hypothetical protein [Paenibacillus ottowii]TQR97347.1 hypothetical protein FKV70_19130 [Paenibacillus ottowii]
MKWENYRVICTVSANQLVIAKVKKTGGFPSIADKSPDKTNEIVGAVYQHIRGEYKKQKATDPDTTSVSLSFADGKIVYYPDPGKGSDLNDRTV